MVRTVKARRMGGSLGATLPREMLDRYHIKEGDDLTVIDMNEGLLISPFNPDFERALAAYERGAKKYKNALRELASS